MIEFPNLKSSLVLILKQPRDVFLASRKTHYDGMMIVKNILLFYALLKYSVPIQS